MGATIRQTAETLADVRAGWSPEAGAVDDLATTVTDMETI